MHWKDDLKVFYTGPSPMRRNTPGYFRFVLFLTVITVVGIVALSSSYFCSSIQAFCDTSNEAVAAEKVKILAPRYLEYSDATLMQSIISSKTVLYFWAPWCSTCSSLDGDIQKDSTIIPLDTIILRVDYDTESELKRKYNVVTQHTFVKIDANGESVTSWVGGDANSVRQRLR